MSSNVVLGRAPGDSRRDRFLDTPEAHRALERIEQLRFKMGTASKGDYAFFLPAIFQLENVCVDWCDTACTDGKRIYWNPSFVEQLSIRRLCGLLCHEVMHPLLLHHTRMGSRDPLIWNIAGDLVINEILANHGLELPPDGMRLSNPMFANFPKDATTESYYSLLEQHQAELKVKFKSPAQDDSDASGHGEDDGNSKNKGKGKSKSPSKQELWGGVLPDQQSESDTAIADEETKWQGILTSSVISAQASRGTLPAGIAALVEQLLQPKLTWRQILAEFLTTYAEGDDRLQFKPPNRRFTQYAQGLNKLNMRIIIPKLRGDHLGKVVFAIDTSGSVDDAMLRDFVSEARAALSSYECHAVVLWHDCVVQGIQEINLSQGQDEKLIPKGRGGTDHVPVFEHIDKHWKDEVTCVVCFTDMETRFPEKPTYPVLWVAANRHRNVPTAPWGRVIPYEASSR